MTKKQIQNEEILMDWQDDAPKKSNTKKNKRKRLEKPFWFELEDEA